MDLNDSPVGANAPTKCTFTKAIMTFFGKLPGQTTVSFAAEIKALNDKDKTDLVEMFKSVGFEVSL